MLLTNLRRGALGLFVLLSFHGFAQKKFTITGLVTEKATGEAVPFAAVAIKGTPQGTTTDMAGNYTLHADRLTDSLLISFIGYKTTAVAINPQLSTQTINISLENEGIQLKEIVVRAGENPAWAIIRKVREHRQQNSRIGLSGYQYHAYSRTDLGVSQLSSVLKNTRYVGKVVNAADRLQKLTDEQGHQVLPLFVSETAADVYHRQNPKATKEVIRKQKATGVGLQDNEAIDQLIGSMNKEFNFYDNYIRILSKDFLSPVNDSWRISYDFDLADSTQIGQRRCYLIDYKPKNEMDLGFTGRLWIDKATWAIVSIDADISEKANLNYVKSLKIQQEYDFIEDKVWLPTQLTMHVELEDPIGTIGRVKAKMAVSNDQFVLNKPQPPQFFDEKIVWEEDAKTSDETFWENERPRVLSTADKQAFAVIDSVKNLREVKQFTRWANVLSSGYVPAGPVEWGPLPLLYAYNQFEGHRLRLGFRTTPLLSRQFFLKGYFAYGTQDQRPKGGLEATWVFSRKKYSALGINVSSDIEQMGVQSDDFSGNAFSNTLFRAFNRFGPFRRPYYTNNATLTYTYEPVQSVAINAGYSFRTFSPTYPFAFRPGEIGGKNEFQSFNNSFLFGELRYAPGELTARNNKNRKVRLRRSRELPVLTFRYEWANPLLGGNLAYHKFTFGVQKSFQLGVLGRTDADLTLGYTPSKVPYPVLFIHQGNPSPLYAPNAYNLMRPFEFVSDQYAALRVQHNFEGLLTNRIPLLNKLNLRTHLTGKIIYGGLSEANQRLTPEFDSRGHAVLRFGTLQPSTPYAEVGYGISNIARFIRVDFIHRLTYLTQPHVPRFGIKIGVELKM